VTAEGLLRVAVLDDYQGVALKMADWSRLEGSAEVDAFTDHVAEPSALTARLSSYDAVVLMRERTALSREVVEALPRLRLIVTTGRRNSAIDVAAAHERGIPVCGTASLATAPAELTWALVLAHARHLVTEARNVEQGGWQTTVGRDLAGRTLGVVGPGRIGAQVARVGAAFGMQVLAWSPRLTPERAADLGVESVALDHLLADSDVVTVHVPLIDGTQGLIGERELALMKPTALLVNTSRSAVVDQGALVSALRGGTLGGAALDVYDEEPLPASHPLRSAPRLLMTPHVGFVTEDVYRLFFTEVVEDIAAFLDGHPVRLLS
jgi:phosphoglycerate dehydrogenase-like enzyme